MPMTRATRLPVLDDDTTRAMVIGWATTRTGAMRVIHRYAARCEMDGSLDVYETSGVCLRYDPDLHTPAEIDRVNRVGRGWIMAGPVDMGDDQCP